MSDRFLERWRKVTPKGEAGNVVDISGRPLDVGEIKVLASPAGGSREVVPLKAEKRAEPQRHEHIRDRDEIPTWGEVVQHIKEMYRYVARPRPGGEEFEPSQESIDARMDELNHYSIDGLINVLWKSDKYDWTKEEAPYYYAVVAKLFKEIEQARQRGEKVPGDSE